MVICRIGSLEIKKVKKMSSLIALVTYIDDKNIKYISHGVNLDTFQNIVLQNETLDYYKSNLKAFYSNDYKAWCIRY